MTRFATIALGLALAALPSSRAEDKKPATDNLLVNGGFEDGPETGPFKSLDKDGTDIKGWTVTRGQIDLVGEYWKAAAGKNSIDLHGSPGRGGVSQTFKTQKGQKYAVTFKLAGNPGGSVPKKTMGVKAAGKEEKFEFDATGKSVEEMGWETKTFEFTAEGDETTLELFTLMTDDDSSGPAIDDVVVTAAK